jgi:hypothetical protein
MARDFPGLIDTWRSGVPSDLSAHALKLAAASSLVAIVGVTIPSSAPTRSGKATRSRATQTSPQNRAAKQVSNCEVLRQGNRQRHCAIA